VSARLSGRSSNHAFWTSVLAASLLVAITLAFWKRSNAPQPMSIEPSLSTSGDGRTYSAVKTISLVSVAYRRVEEDLDRADRVADAAFKGLDLAEIRREIQNTLEEYYDWSEQR
jgi:hypothetical protein